MSATRTAAALVMAGWVLAGCGSPRAASTPPGPTTIVTAPVAQAIAPSRPVPCPSGALAPCTSITDPADPYTVHIYDGDGKGIGTAYVSVDQTTSPRS